MIVMYEHLLKQTSIHDKMNISMSNEYLYVRQYTWSDWIGPDTGIQDYHVSGLTGCQYARYTSHDKINVAFF